MEPLRLVGLLAETNRRKIVAALLLGAANNNDICNAANLTTREVVDGLARLESGGLVEFFPGGEVMLLEAAFELAGRQGRTNEPVAAANATSEEIVLARAVVDGRIRRWPSKQSKQRVVLDWLVQRFEPGVKYTERQVNSQLVQAHLDTAAMRRYLVDFGMLDRSDGEYWRSGGSVEP